MRAATANNWLQALSLQKLGMPVCYTKQSNRTAPTFLIAQHNRAMPPILHRPARSPAESLLLPCWGSARGVLQAIVQT